MNLLGVRLNLLIGPAPMALPAPLGMLEALTEVEVTHSDRERSGFRLSLAVGRGSPLDFLDYDLVASPLLKVGSRVVLTVVFDITPRVIMDGIVTKRDVIPGDQPGQGRGRSSRRERQYLLRERRPGGHQGAAADGVADRGGAGRPW